MRKKLIFILTPVVIVFLAALCIVAFYSVPFVKLNSLLRAANKAQIEYQAEDESCYISQKNYNKLCIVDRAVTDDEYVRLKTSKKLNFNNLKSIDITCSVKATVILYDENTTSDVYNGKIAVSFTFTDNKWRVSNVETVK